MVEAVWRMGIAVVVCGVGREFERKTLHVNILSLTSSKKMMNIPGSLIRGAGSVVGGTMSAVASVAGGGGRRGSSDMSNEIVVKEKSVLTIKVSIYISLLNIYLGNTCERCSNNNEFICINRIFNEKE